MRNAIFFSGVAIIVVACSSTTKVPLQHRTTAGTCGPNVFSRLNGADGGAGPIACTTDAQCTQCLAGQTAGCHCAEGQCTLDQCTTDADCTAAQTCTCARDINAGDGGGGPHNLCVPSDCRTDADCPNGYCSPSADPNGGPFYGTRGWYCHGPDDACTYDSDCPSGEYCAFFPDSHAWACGSERYAG
jgi:hypothetical protein